MLNTDIQIFAEIQANPRVCRFEVSRVVYRGGVGCSNRELAQGSPLFERLFDLPWVEEVYVRQNDILISKKSLENSPASSSHQEWRDLAKQAGSAIREVLSNVRECFPQEYLDRQKTAPPVGSGASAELEDRLRDVIANDINPMIAAHGGFVELIGIQGDTATVQMGGGCHGCGMAKVTLKQGIEVRIREKIPEIKHVMDVTDHSEGQNPYYQS